MPVETQLRQMRILVVDDVAVNVELLSRMLADAGYTNVDTTTDPLAALQSCAQHMPDLLLLDLHMPVLTGYEVLDALGPSIHSGLGPAVLVLTSDVTVEARRRALDAGARDFVSKPFDYDEVLLRVRNHLEMHYFQRELDAQNKRLETAVRSRTRELEASRMEVLDRLALVAEYRDDATNHHARRIGRASVMLARRLDLPAETLELLEQAASLHDVGKIAVSDTILRKPGRLTPGEFAVMRSHHRRRADPRGQPVAGPATGGADRPHAPRALGRHGLPARPRRAGHPARRSHRRRRGRLRRAHARAALQAGVESAGGRGRDRRRRRDPVRPRRRGRLRGARAGDARRSDRRGPVIGGVLRAPRPLRRA